LRNSLLTPPATRAPRRSFAARLTVFGTAAAIIASPAVVVTAANAAPGDPFAVTSPADGATNVASEGTPLSGGAIVTFSGTGLPTDDYVDVSYLDALGVPHKSSFGGTNYGADGDWTAPQTFDRLTPGQTQVIASVRALDNETGDVDVDVPPTTVTFSFATAPVTGNELTVTRPVTNSSTPVEDTTPVFVGRGLPGATIQITYGARSLQTAIAAEVEVDEDGDWSTETDFSQLEPGVTEGSAIVTEYNPDGTPAAGESGQRVNFVFPEAPVAQDELAIEIAPNPVTLTQATTTGVAFGVTGFSPNEELDIVVTDPNGGEVVLEQTEASFFADEEFGTFLGTVVLPDTAGTGEYTITVTGVRSERTVSGTFAVVTDPTTPVVPGAGNGGTLPIVAG